MRAKAFTATVEFPISYWMYVLGKNSVWWVSEAWNRLWFPAMLSKSLPAILDWSTNPVRSRLLFLVLLIIWIPILTVTYYILVEGGSLRSFFSTETSHAGYQPCQSTQYEHPSTQLRSFYGPGSPGFQQEGRHSLLGEALQGANSEFLLLRDVDGKTDSYGVSMYHQLHCLGMIREHLARSNVGSGDHDHHLRNLESQDDHLLHCVDYLSQVRLCIPSLNSIKWLHSWFHRSWLVLQAVVCAADDTIEPARIKVMPSGEKMAIIDGLENQHYCSDSQLVHKLVEKSHSKPFKVQGLVKGQRVTALFSKEAFWVHWPGQRGQLKNTCAYPPYSVHFKKLEHDCQIA